MKKVLVVLTFLMALPAFADFKSVEEAETKLKTFASSQFEHKDSKEQEKLEDDIVDGLIDAVQWAVKTPKAESLRKEVVRVAVILLKQDKSLYGAEIVLPLYKQNRTEFKKLLQSLPSPDARLLDDSVKNAEREAGSGNG